MAQKYKIHCMRKNLEEIQDQIAICAKKEIKVKKKGKKSLKKSKKEIKV